MEKGNLLVVLFVMLAGNMYAQTATSIKFQEVDFAAALKSAAANDKLVFIDCYTSWCAPCKKWIRQRL